MRSRHVPGALAVVLALVALALPPATAAVVQTSLPAGITTVSEDCLGTADGSVDTVSGPAGVSGATGAGSLRLHQGDVTDVVGIAHAFDLLSTFSSVSFDFYDPDSDHYGPAPSDASTWLDIRVTTADGTFDLTQPLKGAPAWQTHEATTATSYVVVQEVGGGWSPPTPTPMSKFLTDHGDGPGTVRILRSPCYGGYATGNVAGWQPPAGIGTDTYLDLVTFSFTGEAATTYDFEDHVYALAGSAARRTITAGEHTVVSGTLTRDGAAFSGAMLSLQRRPWGHAGWSLAGTALTDATGRAALDVHPVTSTDYRWTYAAAMPTPAIRIGVRTRLTLALADATLRHGQRLVATGRTTPAKPGVTVTLRRRTATGTVRLASATVTATGSYRIAKALTTPGTYRVFVTIPAATGNLAGSSVVRTAQVS